jgi:hypothetical protein
VIGFDLRETMEGEFAKGYHAVSLSKEDLSPGLLHYPLVTPKGTMTKKMIPQ